MCHTHFLFVIKGVQSKGRLCLEKSMLNLLKRRREVWKCVCVCVCVWGGRSGGTAE